MKGLHKQIIGIASILILMGIAVGIGGTAPAFAEEAEDGVVLQVLYGDELIAEYTERDLNEMVEKEGSKTYSFSGMNTYPTPELIEDEVTGVTVEGILEDAFRNCTEKTVPTGIDALQDDQLLEIRESASKGAYNAVYTMEQFRTKRYCFPKVMKEKNRKGAPALDESYQGKEEVPAVISMDEKTDPAKRGRFLIGQITPHEQNKPEWVQGVVSGTKYPGQIIVRSDRTEDRAVQWNALTTIDTDAKGRTATNHGITIDRSVNEFSENGGGRYWIYYTTDGTEPTKKSAIYNYNNKNFGLSSEKLNRPVFTKAGEAVIKAKVYGNGKIDSESTEFRIKVVDPIPVNVQIAGESGSSTYDGKTHIWNNYSVTSSDPQVVNVEKKHPKEDFVTAKHAGTYNMELSKDDFEVSMVSEFYELGELTISDGSFRILPRALTVTTESKSRAYNGKALTAGGKLTGLADGETLMFSVTGKQIDIGKSKNSYSLRWNGTAKAGDYTIEETLGTLTVTTPSINAPTLKNLSTKSRAITVKWSRVNGANGYQIYRATKKNGKYTKVKTIKNEKTVSFKNSKLKKNQKYYYKVRAYRTIAGRNFYSKFSAVKNIKVK